MAQRIPVEDCVCTTEWKDAIGRVDPVTREWVETPVKHVSLVRAPDCPIHKLWYLGSEVKLVETLEDGWMHVQFPPEKKLWKLWHSQIKISFRPAW